MEYDRVTLQFLEFSSNTVDCYRIIGRVAEFDTPARLLEDRSSMFLKLVSEYSSRSSGIPDY